ncbi:hypothetical protein PMIN04_012285, partial [Paraphaeosphaeria minitans]
MAHRRARKGSVAQWAIGEVHDAPSRQRHSAPERPRLLSGASLGRDGGLRDDVEQQCRPVRRLP